LPPSPDEVWRNRKPIPCELRQEFLKTVEQLELDIKKDFDYNVPRDDNDPKKKKARKETIRREAIGQACVAFGLLKVQRRVICLPIIAEKCAIFSR
jgi:hypothetical protein